MVLKLHVKVVSHMNFTEHGCVVQGNRNNIEIQTKDGWHICAVTKDGHSGHRLYNSTTYMWPSNRTKAKDLATTSGQDTVRAATSGTPAEAGGGCRRIGASVRVQTDGRPHNLLWATTIVPWEGCHVSDSPQVEAPPHPDTISQPPAISKHQTCHLTSQMCNLKIPKLSFEH